MKRIRLKEYQRGRWEDTASFYVDGDLTIHFDGMDAIGEYSAVVSVNNEAFNFSPIIDRQITIPKEKLQAGKLCMTVYLKETTRGEKKVVAAYPCEPLLLFTESKGFTADPEIVYLRERLCLAEEAVEKLSKSTEENFVAARKEAEEHLNTVKTGSEARDKETYRLIVLTSYTAYRRSLTEDELDLRPWALKFGLDLSIFNEEELAAIEQAAKENDDD